MAINSKVLLLSIFILPLFCFYIESVQAFVFYCDVLYFVTSDLQIHLLLLPLLLRNTFYSTYSLIYLLTVLQIDGKELNFSSVR